MARRYKKYRTYRKDPLYSSFSFISWIIRQYLLPNPFSNLFESEMAYLVNLIFGVVLVLLAYFLTGTWYVSSKREYWKGSFGFLINFSLLTGLILFISKFVANIYWLVLIFVFIYIFLCILEANYFNRNRSLF